MRNAIGVLRLSLVNSYNKYFELFLLTVSFPVMFLIPYLYIGKLDTIPFLLLNLLVIFIWALVLIINIILLQVGVTETLLAIQTLETNHAYDLIDAHPIVDSAVKEQFKESRIKITNRVSNSFHLIHPEIDIVHYRQVD